MVRWDFAGEYVKSCVYQIAFDCAPMDIGLVISGDYICVAPKLRAEKCVFPGPTKGVSRVDR